jgi:hypothetical protein
MTQNLSLVVLAGYAGLFLIAGFVWKKVRDYRDQLAAKRMQQELWVSRGC